MGLTVTEDTPADMLAGNMELLVQLPPRNDDDYDDENYDGDSHHRNHHRHHNHHHNGHQRRTSNGNARRVVVARSTPMMDLLVQVATSQKLSASSYTLEAIGEHGLVLTHHPNTPIGALDALQVKLLPKQGTFVPMKARHVNQPFETTFRLQVHLPRNQLYVSRVSSRMNLGKILDDVCREKNLDRNKYELCHPANIEETLDLSLSLQDYHLQEVTLCPKRRSLGSSLSSQDIMALQRQEERRRQDAKQSVFGFAFKKSKESSLSTDSLGERSVSPTRSDGTGRSASPQAPTRPQRKRRPAPKPPMPQPGAEPKTTSNSNSSERKAEESLREREREGAERIIISHSRNSSDSSGYHEASVLSDNPESNIRVPETLPRRGRLIPTQESPARTLAESSQASKSLGNLAVVQPAPRIARVTSNSSLSSAGGLRKKKAAPAPPPPRPLSSAISTQALERIVDSEESFTSDAEPSGVAVAPEPDEPPAAPETKTDPERRKSVQSTPEAAPPSIPIPEVAIVPAVETPSDSRQKRDSEEETKSVSLNGNAESPTSDLLKKVSDTLSESLRSTEASLANDREPLSTAQRCVDEPQAPKDDGVNEARPRSEKREEYVGSVETVSTETDGTDFLQDRQTQVVKQFQNTTEDQPSSTIDWEYPIPEPPSEFRDNAVVEIPAKKSLFIPEDGPKSIAEAARSNRVDIRPEEPAVRARTVSVTSSESRRGSHASSTPTVAPVDNTLSNFVITTYSRPKNVDIFDEVRSPVSRKNSGTGSKPTSVIVEEVRKTTEPQPPEKFSTFVPEDRHVESSNIKISIATKPRPRADSVEVPKPKIIEVEIGKGDDSAVPKGEIATLAEETSGNQKFSKWRDDILKKHETPDKETQLQSAQVLKSILPQLEGIQRSSSTHIVAVEKSASNPSEETRVIAAVPKTEESSPNVDQTLPVSPPKEPATKRYTYAGPPAIDLGSWSDRSRTTRVQIKPDSDYKVETSQNTKTLEKETPSVNKERSSTVTVNKTSGTTTVLLQNSSKTLIRKSSVTSRFEKESKEQPNELAKVMRAQSNGGFRRPASIAVDPSRDGDKELQRILGGGDRRDEIVEKEDEVDTRPISFKDLKQAFAKDQNSGSAPIPKYGGYPRRLENSGPKFTVRRDSFNSSNAEPENLVHARINKPVGSGQEKRSFVAPAANNFRNGFQEATRKTSRGTLMPVVKGFKSVVSEEEEKRSANVNRIAIGDISNGNYVPKQNGLRKTAHIRVEDTNGVPKPPTMPVITGVTLKTTNYNSNTRPKSMPAAEPDDRNQLLESIRNFGTDQLKRVPRRNTNVVGMAPGSRSVRS